MRVYLIALIDRLNYIEGVKVIIAYMDELAKQMQQL